MPRCPCRSPASQACGERSVTHGTTSVQLGPRSMQKLKRPHQTLTDLKSPPLPPRPLPPPPGRRWTSVPLGRLQPKVPKTPPPPLPRTEKPRCPSADPADPEKAQNTPQRGSPERTLGVRPQHPRREPKGPKMTKVFFANYGAI